MGEDAPAPRGRLVEPVPKTKTVRRDMAKQARLSLSDYCHAVRRAPTCMDDVDPRTADRVQMLAESIATSMRLLAMETKAELGSPDVTADEVLAQLRVHTWSP